jgi:hypothetical protein
MDLMIFFLLLLPGRRLMELLGTIFALEQLAVVAQMAAE